VTLARFDEEKSPMTVETLRFDVARLLADVSEHIRETETLLGGGTDHEKVKAAGDLVALRHKKDALDARLTAIDHAPHTNVAGLLERLREEGLMLRESLAAIVTH
jgi:hypothetical protein